VAREMGPHAVLQVLDGGIHQAIWEIKPFNT
jgi:hypothetical protein